MTALQGFEGIVSNVLVGMGTVDKEEVNLARPRREIEVGRVAIELMDSTGFGVSCPERLGFDFVSCPNMIRSIVAFLRVPQPSGGRSSVYTSALEFAAKCRAVYP